MIWTSIEVLSTIFETALMIFFVSKVLDFNKSFNRIFVIGGMSLFILICNVFHVSWNIPTIAVILFGITIAFMFSNAKWYSKIFTVIVYYLMLILFDAIVSITFSKILTIPISAIIEFGYSRAICIIISKMLLFVACLIITKRFSVKNKTIEPSYYVPIVFIIISCFVVSAIILENILRINNLNIEHNQLMTLLISYIIISFFFIYIFNKSIISSENKFKLQMLNTQLLFQEANITEIKENHLEIRKIWHDVYNHLNNLALLMKNYKYDECIKFLENYTRTISDIKITINSGNVFIDALVSRKSSECANNNIEFFSDIILSDEIKIDNIDMCIIVGNALDNSIEASEKESLGDRKIKLQIKMINNYILIKITNKANQNPLLANSNFTTIKSDKKHHGFGMVNINDIVKKYDGDLKLSYDNNEFVFDSILKNTPIIQ
jgi:sensor histidine kinase YesM